tara:strand:+ start:7835 stop:8368 length:534 start_codon:yes stop_codon:yes gene_type:complete
MAYQKIQVNTTLALELIASDTLPIPAPNLEQLTGTTTATTTDKLVDVGADFSNVNIGDIIYNTTDNTSATVVAIDSSTILDISADIFTSPENYTIFLGGPNGSSRINSSEGCLLYVGSSEATMSAAKSFVDVKVKTASGSDVIFRNFRVGDYLPVQVLQLYATGTDTAALNSCMAIW